MKGIPRGTKMSYLFDHILFTDKYPPMLFESYDKAMEFVDAYYIRKFLIKSVEVSTYSHKER